MTRRPYHWDGRDVVDVLLVPTPYPNAAASGARPEVYFDECLPLTDDVFLGPVEAELANRIADACYPRGENFSPSRIYGFPYGFIHAPAAVSDNELAFDPDNRLFAAVALSRLIHPTSVGFEHSARLRPLPDGTQQIVATRQHHLNPAAFVVDPGNDWLLPDDVAPLRQLLKAYHDPTISKPNRVRAALWYHEAGSRSYYIDVTWALFTTGLEALIRDEKTPAGKWVGSTRAFVDRLLAIGNLVPALAVPEADLREMYELRSLIVHGMVPAASDPRSFSLLQRKQALLAGIIKHALLQPAFAAIFESDAALRSGLPLR